MEKNLLIEEYLLAEVKFRKVFLKIPVESYDFVPPIKDAWTIRQHVIHLVDSDINNFIRIKSCIAQPQSNCFVIQEEQWVENLQNKKENLNNYLKVFHLLREIMFDFLENITEVDFNQKYYIRDYKSQTRKITIREAIEIYTDHVKDHIRYIERNAEEFSRGGNAG